jgi:GrpB-like predicted nucleotidyltransferase (UPF0157 family)
MPPEIIVCDYAAAWPDQFAQLKQIIWPAVRDLALAIEHVGSTAVPGLAAKPIIDLDIVISNARDLPAIIERLKNLGYEHLGNLGIENREAFRAPLGPIDHHLYVCLAESIAFKNHIRLRDRLRNDALVRKQYGDLKRDLALKFPDSIDAYVDGKTEFILNLLKDAGMAAPDLESIRNANKIF